MRELDIFVEVNLLTCENEWRNKYIYEVSSGGKGKMKDSKKIWGGIIVWRQIP